MQRLCPQLLWSFVRLLCDFCPLGRAVVQPPDQSANSISGGLFNSVLCCLKPVDQENGMISPLSQCSHTIQLGLWNTREGVMGRQRCGQYERRKSPKERDKRAEEHGACENHQTLWYTVCALEIHVLQLKPLLFSKMCSTPINQTVVVYWRYIWWPWSSNRYDKLLQITKTRQQIRQHNGKWQNTAAYGKTPTNKKTRQNNGIVVVFCDLLLLFCLLSCFLIRRCVFSFVLFTFCLRSTVDRQCVCVYRLDNEYQETLV